jgi:hypothetical protein
MIWRHMSDICLPGLERLLLMIGPMKKLIGALSIASALVTAGPVGCVDNSADGDIVEQSEVDYPDLSLDGKSDEARALFGAYRISRGPQNDELMSIRVLDLRSDGTFFMERRETELLDGPVPFEEHFISSEGTYQFRRTASGRKIIRFTSPDHNVSISYGSTARGITFVPSRPAESYRLERVAKPSSTWVAKAKSDFTNGRFQTFVIGQDISTSASFAAVKRGTTAPAATIKKQNIDGVMVYGISVGNLVELHTATSQLVARSSNAGESWTTL